MEPSGRNRWQLVANGTGPNTPQIADRQPLATHGNGFDGKEGVDGSSPSEGSAKTPHADTFAYVFSRRGGL